MRSICKACLVLALVLLVLPLAGISSASAKPTKLCRANEESCSKANTYALNGDNFKGTLGGGAPNASKLVMSGLGTVSCTVGKLSAELKETEGPLSGEIVQWSGFLCTPEGCTLSVPAEPTGFIAEVEATTGGNGILTIGSTPTLIAKCTSPAYTCVYSVATMKFAIQGGAEEKANISTETAMTKNAAKSSLICPSGATYVGRQRMVEPSDSALFITH